MDKTTASVNIAACLARLGRAGIVVDLDAQQLHSMKFANSIPGVTFQTTVPNTAPKGGFVIVDTSPAITGATGAALNRSDLVICPCPVDAACMEQIENETFATLAMLHAKRPDIGALVFFSHVDRLRMTQRAIEEFEARSPWPVCPHRIDARRGDFQRAYKAKTPLLPESVSGQQYAALTQYIVELFV